jgi:predicted metal-dependent hydrolase
VAPFKGVRVAVPYGISFEEAERIARSHEKWVLRRLANMQKAEREYLSVAGNTAGVDGEKAKDFLEKRINELAGAHGFSYNKLIVRAQKAQWGSCSPKNRISLNIKLAHLPEELVDYVIMHELAHTRVKNHGKRFWRLLDSLFGDAKALDSRLRRYHLGLL